MEDNLITIASYPYTRALMLQNRLEMEGIECSLENMNRIRPIVPEDVRVKVQQSDFQQAIKIIEEIQDQYDQVNLKRDEIQNFKITKILVPIDFTEFSKSTALYALSVAEKFGTEIMLFHTFETPIVDTIPTEGYVPEANYALTELEAKVKKQLTSLKTTLEEIMISNKIANVKISVEMVFGAPTEEILYFAKEWKPNIIIMGTRGIQDPMNSFLGSVAAKVIEDAKIPVIVIPSTKEFFQFEANQNLMFATNFDEADFVAIAQMYRIIEPLSLKVNFVHFDKTPTRWNKLKLYGLREYIKRKYHKNAECHLIQCEEFSRGMDQFVKKNNIRMVVFVTHKRNFFNRIFNSGKTKDILFYSTTPLLIFHGK